MEQNCSTATTTASEVRTREERRGNERKGKSGRESAHLCLSIRFWRSSHQPSSHPLTQPSVMRFNCIHPPQPYYAFQRMHRITNPQSPWGHDNIHTFLPPHSDAALNPGRLGMAQPYQGVRQLVIYHLCEQKRPPYPPNDIDETRPAHGQSCCSTRFQQAWQS